MLVFLFLTLLLSAHASSPDFCQVLNLCNSQISFPIGVTTKTCSERICGPVPDPCASKQDVTYPCPVQVKECKECHHKITVPIPCTIERKVCVAGICRKVRVPSTCPSEQCVYGCDWVWKPKTCTNSVCVPGTREECVQVEIPCDIELEYKKIGICDEIPSDIKNLIEKASGICPCLAKASELIPDNYFGDPTKISSSALSSAAEVASCMMDVGFQIHDNKDTTLEQLKPSGLTIIEFGPEIDTAFYIRFAACVVSGTLSGNWMDLVYLFEEKFTEIRRVPEKAIASATKIVKQQVDAVVEKAQNLILSVRDTEIIIMDPTSNDNHLKALEELLCDCKRLLELMDQTYQTLVAFPSLDFKSHLLKAISNGQIPSLSSPLEVLTSLEDCSQISAIASQIAQRVRELQNPSTANALRSLFGDKFAELEGALKNCKIHGLDFNVGVASYQRWSRISMDVPSITTSEKCLGRNGLQKCVNIPDIKIDKFNQQIQFPNHHIPYIQLTLE